MSQMGGGSSTHLKASDLGDVVCSQSTRGRTPCPTITLNPLVGSSCLRWLLLLRQLLQRDTAIAPLSCARA